MAKKIVTLSFSHVVNIIYSCFVIIYCCVLICYLYTIVQTKVTTNKDIYIYISNTLWKISEMKTGASPSYLSIQLKS
jgi:hypothetical protein